MKSFVVPLTNLPTFNQNSPSTKHLIKTPHLDDVLGQTGNSPFTNKSSKFDNCNGLIPNENKVWDNVVIGTLH